MNVMATRTNLGPSFGTEILVFGPLTKVLEIYYNWIILCLEALIVLGYMV